MKLTREELLHIYRTRVTQDSLEHLAWPTADRDLSPAELCYTAEEKDELDQCAPYPP